MVADMDWQKLRPVVDFVLHVYHRYKKDGCGDSAAALTYMSLFALVPLMTVIYSILSAVPAFQAVGDQIQGMIFDNFIPSTGQSVQNYLEEFSSQARSLSGIGVAFLGVTAIFMLKNIEKTFNAIWHTHENRRGLSSFLLYWAILSLGPLFIGIALGISTYLLSLKVFVEEVDSLGVTTFLLSFTPYFLTSAAFTLMFAAIPNCKVLFRHALAGGLITGLVFELAKQLFGGIVANTSIEAIYGTFAAVPLFLLWVYVSWQIVLAGAEFTRALEGYSDGTSDRYSDLTLSLAILHQLWLAQRAGRAVPDHRFSQQSWLFGKYSLSDERWVRLREHLLDEQLIAFTDRGEFFLVRDLHQYTLWDLADSLNGIARADDDGDNPYHWFYRSQTLLQQQEENGRDLFDLNLADLFAETPDLPVELRPVETDTA